MPHVHFSRFSAVVVIAGDAVFRGETIEAEEDLSDYGDAASVSEWVKEQMRWAVASELSRGQNASLKPQSKALRSLIAQM